ncbi:hypothetical protein E5K00_09615 [Hymenobacter aquaticus]|uniref:Uncharacterized protein n=1 Tax=Hymenobacter aquaticus TaxID=1867101 RepID=A0A4Z0Q7I7_9BACT|nr:hypothetical protein [Hymenobacter aquaticus]TGE25426.1 hypothetical protein E5K00_09615 [Hymenobacter aquaticus]
MKRFALISLFSVLLVTLDGCRSLDKALFTVPTAALNTRLPVLETNVEASALSRSTGATADDAQKLFRLELDRNLMDDKDTTTYGTIRLNVSKVATQRTGRGLHIFQLATLLTPSLLGIPIEWFETQLQAEVQVVDVKDNVLATYKGKGSSKIRVAAYHGYSQKGAPRLADVEALRQALNEIRPKLAADAKYLREQLILAKTAGVVTISDVPGFSTGEPADSTAQPAPAGSKPE